MKKKIIPIVIAIVLIIIIGGVTFGSRILEKYSYSKERADLNAYYGITGSQEAAIVLQDEIVEERPGYQTASVILIWQRSINI